MTSIDFHTGNLDKLCRVCGNKMKRGRKVFTVADHIIGRLSKKSARRTNLTVSEKSPRYVLQKFFQKTS